MSKFWGCSLHHSSGFIVVVGGEVVEVAVVVVVVVVNEGSIAHTRDPIIVG